MRFGQNGIVNASGESEDEDEDGDDIDDTNDDYLFMDYNEAVDKSSNEKSQISANKSLKVKSVDKQIKSKPGNVKNGGIRRDEKDFLNKKSKEKV
jgi:hypothetical protein